MPTAASAFRRIIYTDPDLRVSDAERNEVADRLATHYSDGRLTQEEFNERVERAMNAKTQSDLDGLFTDLPTLGEPSLGEPSLGEPSLGGPRGPVSRASRAPGRRGRHPVLGLALVVALVLVIAHGLVAHWLALLVIAGVAVYLIRAFERGHCRRDRTP